MNPIVTLLTDFGWEDPYVAVMKGVILSECRNAQTVDACHHVAAQQVRQAAWVLGGYWNYYPEDTIHVVVVDPGVGTDRSALVLRADGRWLIAPDNGVLDLVIRSAGEMQAYRIKSGWSRPGALSSTFHGRDVFAYAAGRIAAGDEVASFAEPMDVAERLSWPKPTMDRRSISGEVVAQDRFGNLITNIPGETVRQDGARVIVGSHVIDRISPTYALGNEGQFLALMASHGFLEIAVKNGSAARMLGVEPIGVAVRVAMVDKGKAE